MKKIIFFDIDGTIVSEKTKKIPESAVLAIRKARDNGHLMFINTGRCYQNVEQRFRDIGFDGYVCGCGTNIIYNNEDLLYVPQSIKVCSNVVELAAKYNLDILFESQKQLCFDESRHMGADARRSKAGFLQRNYDLTANPYAPDFTFDKFVIWIRDDSDFDSFLQGVQADFECIDRGNNFREFVPHGYSKATGIQFVLDYFDIPFDNAFAIGDSNNDLPMLKYVKNSIAMGNSSPTSLFDEVSFVTKDVDDNGIEYALSHFNFI